MHVCIVSLRASRGRVELGSTDLEALGGIVDLRLEFEQ